MAYFGKRSTGVLATCHNDLQIIMRKVILIRDCSIICGLRTKKEQNNVFELGKSKVKWPNSKHNACNDRVVSHAVDIVPWPEQYTDPTAMIYLAGIVLGVAETLHKVGTINHKIRWGGDWNMDRNMTDNNFDDFWHFELIE